MDNIQISKLKEKAIVFILVITFFLPNLLSPHFGLLDDPVIINRSSDVFNFIFSALRARLTVFGLFYYAFVNMFGIGKPIVSTIIVLFVLYAISLLVFLIIKKVTNKPLLGYIGVLLYLFSPGTVENTFTIFKVELFLQLLFSIIAFLLLTFKAGKSWIKALLLYLLTFITYFTKETAVIMLPLSLSLLLLDSVQRGKKTKFYRFFFIYNFAVFAVQFLVLKFFVSFSPGSYAGMYLVKPRRMILTFIQYMQMLSPFILYAIVLIVAWVIESINKYLKEKTISIRYQEAVLAFMAILYFVVLLPWVWPSPYYVNPAMLFLVLFSVVVFYRYMREGRKHLLYLITVLLVFNFALSVNNYINEGRVRKNTDKIDNELIGFAKNSQKNSKFLLGINQSSEYVYEIDQFDQFNKRRDVSVRGYDKDDERMVLKRDELVNNDYLVINYSKNVYFNRIVWNTGLTLKSAIEKDCLNVKPIADYQYTIKGLMFGSEDNLPFYYISAYPKLKNIQKEWLIYRTQDISPCIIQQR